MKRILAILLAIVTLIGCSKIDQPSEVREIEVNVSYNWVEEGSILSSLTKSVSVGARETLLREGIEYALRNITVEIRDYKTGGTHYLSNGSKLAWYEGFDTLNLSIRVYGGGGGAFPYIHCEAPVIVYGNFQLNITVSVSLSSWCIFYDKNEVDVKYFDYQGNEIGISVYTDSKYKDIAFRYLSEGDVAYLEVYPKDSSLYEPYIVYERPIGKYVILNLRPKADIGISLVLPDVEDMYSCWQREYPY